jgi:uncharacterized protein YegJ (DUF2314 family)
VVAHDPVSGVVQVRSNDEQMTQAMLAARGSIKRFLDAHKSPKPNQTGFYFKVCFEIAGQVEHVWLSDLELETTPPTGVVANSPRLPGLVYGQRVTFEKPWVTDWVYTENGEMVGGYTTRVLMQMRNRPVSGGLLSGWVKRIGRKTTDS